MSFARGPALIMGTILLAAGLYLMYRAHTYPRFSNLPQGTAHPDGKFLLGLFGANGWTGMFTAVCGGLLLFGAAQHLLAKTMSLIVGVALGAAAAIAFVSGDVLGMAAANGWTELGWAVCSVILLFNTLMPRSRREVVVEDDVAARRRYREPGTAATAVPAGAPADERGRMTDREPVADRANQPMADRADQPVADRVDQPAGDRADQPMADRADQQAADRADGAPAEDAGERNAGADQPTTPLHPA